MYILNVCRWWSSLVSFFTHTACLSFSQMVCGSLLGTRACEVCTRDLHQVSLECPMAPSSSWAMRSWRGPTAVGKDCHTTQNWWDGSTRVLCILDVYAICFIVCYNKKLNYDHVADCCNETSKELDIEWDCLIDYMELFIYFTGEYHIFNHGSYQQGCSSSHNLPIPSGSGQTAGMLG